MSKKSEKNLIVGLDIGTSKVVAIVGEINESNQIEVVGIGMHPSRGLKKGVVVNIESTVHSIQKAIEEAEAINELGAVITSSSACNSKSRIAKCKAHVPFAVLTANWVPHSVANSFSKSTTSGPFM